jgi:hypothetical protein
MRLELDLERARLRQLVLARIRRDTLRAERRARMTQRVRRAC